MQMGRWTQNVYCNSGTWQTIVFDPADPQIV
jgi:hypothetical protein